MEMGGEFVSFIRFMLHAIAIVAEQARKLGRNQIVVHSNVGIRVSILSGPAPDFAEHLLMQCLGKLIIQYIGRFSSASPCPRRAVQDVLCFRLVEVGTSSDPGLPKCLTIIRRQVCRVVGFLKQIGHGSFQRSRSFTWSRMYSAICSF